MKKITVLGAAALLMTSGSVFAGEFVDEVGAELVFSANADISGLGSGTAIAFKASKKMDDVVVEGFSVEAELTKSLSGPSSSSDGVKLEGSYLTIGAFGKYAYGVTDEISVYGRLGLAYGSGELTYSCSGNIFACSGYDASTSSISLAYGFGGGYAFSDTLSVIAGYSAYDIDGTSLTHMSVGVSMLFD